MNSVQQVSDGLKKELLKAGSGPLAAKGKTITVNCTGSVNGNPPKKFWRYIAASHLMHLFSPVDEAVLLATFVIYVDKRHHYT